MRCFDRFRHDEKGSATIEFVLWVPIIVALLTIVIDATTLYITHNEMWNVARDTARRMVTGNLLTEPQAEQYAVDAMELRDFPYFVRADYDDSDPTHPEVAVTIALSVGDMSILGYGSPLTLFAHDMAARVIMRGDPLVPFDSSAGGGGGGGEEDGPPGQNKDNS